MAASPALASQTSKAANSALVILAAALRKVFGSRPLSTTRAPCSASASAMAKPSPRDAPVTSATRPLSEKRSLIGSPLQKTLPPASHRRQEERRHANHRTDVLDDLRHH